jgi:hypothetical protein
LRALRVGSKVLQRFVVHRARSIATAASRNMNREQLERDLAPLVQTLRVVVGALVVSIIGATGAMIFLRGKDQQGWNISEGGIVTLCALAFAIASPLMAAVIARQTVTTTRRKLAAGEVPVNDDGTKLSKKQGQEADIEALAMLYSTKTIILASILEGAAFFNAIAFLIEGDLLTVVASGLSAIGVASQFPTITRVVNWVEDQLARLKEDRAFLR